ncbi:MAG TPA: hypothetical protein VL326_04450 [Kofleriaceae bacterium]|jgi:hypothetical protein|nr:hypothetical protein [Kofleriaceae bacterium]
MGALDNFLRRFGYAKLDRYGLMLTGDDRVLSTRPAVLDDGLGGKIVGWTDDDLAAMELEHIGVPKAKAPAKPIAAPASLHVLPPAPPPMPIAAKVVAPAAKVASAPKLPGMPPVAVAPIAQPPVVQAPVIAPEPPKVADEPAEGEDEWEWDIMMAKARAAAEEVQQAAAMIATAATAPTKRKTSPGMVSPSVRAKTEPPVRSMPKPVAAIEPRKTVIPVPTLQGSAKPSDLKPYTPSAPPRRLPRGTQQPLNEDTVQTQIAPSNDDHTSPYVTLPSEVKPVGYAHTKRVAAKQR